MLFDIHWNLSSNWTFAWSILPILLIGLEVTIKATVFGFLLALILGLPLALLRAVPFRIISWPTALVIEFIRDTPLLVQLYFVYYVLPDYGIIFSAFLTGTIALGIQYSAYTAEVYRAGMEAVPPGQWEAAKALSLHVGRIYRDIVIPQAVPRVVPAMGNYLISIIKDTPILSVVTVLEVLNVAKIIGDRTFRYLIPLSMVGALFLILTVVSSALIRYVEYRLPKEGIALK
jgi:polar amino acid transport system permease protein